jgi:hypothetical protein
MAESGLRTWVFPEIRKIYKYKNVKIYNIQAFQTEVAPRRIEKF